MTAVLKRLTTEYSEVEDRIRLSGEVPDAPPVVIWLTRRLLDRLLPVLVSWLEGEGGAGNPGAAVRQSFAQQAARADLRQQAPVVAAPESTAWLAQAVDIGRTPQAVTLTFRGREEGQVAAVTMNAKFLRQWLGIVHAGYCRAKWPVLVWPDWLREGAAPVSSSQVVMH